MEFFSNEDLPNTIHTRQLWWTNSREMCECATIITATSSRSSQCVPGSARGQRSTGPPRLWMVAREMRGTIVAILGGEAGGEGLVMAGREGEGEWWRSAY